MHATTKLGRPSKLTNDTAWTLVGLLVAGRTLNDAAAAVGVSPRTVQRWRKRAYSSRPEDAAYVEIEQALWRGKLAAAEYGQRRVETPVALVPLDELYRDLDG